MSTVNYSVPSLLAVLVCCGISSGQMTNAERAFKFLEDPNRVEDLTTPREIKFPTLVPAITKDLMFERTWQDGRSCGPVSLYFLLRLNRISVSLDDVVHRVVTDERGCSLRDLQISAEHFGLETASIKLTPDDLLQLPKPAIVHYSLPGKGGGTADHFDVIIRDVLVEDKPMLDIIDTTNCMVYRRPIAAIGPQMSGFALIPSSVSRDGKWLPALWAGFVGVVIANLLAALYLVVKKRRYIGSLPKPDRAVPSKEQQ